MNVEFGPVQHTEEGDRYDILVNGFEIGVVYPETGYAYINQTSLWESVDKALQKRFNKKVETLEVD